MGPTLSMNRRPHARVAGEEALHDPRHQGKREARGKGDRKGALWRVAAARLVGTALEAAVSIRPPIWSCRITLSRVGTSRDFSGRKSASPSDHLSCTTRRLTADWVIPSCAAGPCVVPEATTAAFVSRRSRRKGHAFLCDVRMG